MNDLGDGAFQHPIRRRAARTGLAKPRGRVLRGSPLAALARPIKTVGGADEMTDHSGHGSSDSVLRIPPMSAVVLLEAQAERRASSA